MSTYVGVGASCAALIRRSLPCCWKCSCTKGVAQNANAMKYQYIILSTFRCKRTQILTTDVGGVCNSRAIHVHLNIFTTQHQFAPNILNNALTLNLEQGNLLDAQPGAVHANLTSLIPIINKYPQRKQKAINKEERLPNLRADDHVHWNHPALVKKS